MVDGRELIALLFCKIRMNDLADDISVNPNRYHNGWYFLKRSICILNSVASLSNQISGSTAIPNNSTRKSKQSNG